MESYNNWGSHNTAAHSAYKSVPKMKKKVKVKRTYRDGTEMDFYEGYGSGDRQVKKHLHKKKRRQFFKKEDSQNI